MEGNDEYMPVEESGNMILVRHFPLFLFLFQSVVLERNMLCNSDDAYDRPFYFPGRISFFKLSSTNGNANSECAR